MTASIYVLDDYRTPAWSALPTIGIADAVVIPSQAHLGVGRVTHVSDIHGVTVYEMTFPKGIVRKLPAREVELFDPDGAA